MDRKMTNTVAFLKLFLNPKDSSNSLDNNKPSSTAVSMVEDRITDRGVAMEEATAE